MIQKNRDPLGLVCYQHAAIERDKEDARGSIPLPWTSARKRGLVPKIDTLYGGSSRNLAKAEKAINLPLIVDEFKIGFHVWIEGRSFIQDDAAAD
jgi:hypothetical protein